MCQAPSLGRQWAGPALRDRGPAAPQATHEERECHDTTWPRLFSTVIVKKESGLTLRRHARLSGMTALPAPPSYDSPADLGTWSAHMAAYLRDTYNVGKTPMRRAAELLNACAVALAKDDRAPIVAFRAPPDAGDEDPPEFAAYVAEIGKPDAAMTQADAERVAAAAVDEAIARRDTRTCGTAAQVALDAFEPGRWFFVTCDFDTHGNTAATVRLR
jgi:hypothetical protein